MRKFTSAFTLLTLLAGLAVAQHNGSALQNAERNYLIGLKHSNNGVVESAIINTMILKTYHPEKDFSQITKKLDSLSLESPKKTIRLKAFIASNYLKHPERFNWIEKGDYEQAIQFFQLYSAKVDEQLNRKKTTVTLNNSNR
ncbi:MAG: hypothetical protein D8M58_19620 [Calditrichaeota bacterium]|nr:MAG: hypothetical protein DWQ03_22300 [Calditrichota bacterium]MBL1207620.1 hypothetical protein [Calditrichota bacterium]NOG47453.1 hypothetical protein [Calditrichota bacterium]